MLLERDVPHIRIEPMMDILKGLAYNKVHLIVLGPELEVEVPADEGNG